MRGGWVEPLALSRGEGLASDEDRRRRSRYFPLGLFLFGLAGGVWSNRSGPRLQLRPTPMPGAGGAHTWPPAGIGLEGERQAAGAAAETDWAGIASGVAG